MAPSARNNDAKRSGADTSSSLDASLSESVESDWEVPVRVKPSTSESVVKKMLKSPVEKLKKVVKPNGMPGLKGKTFLPTMRRVSELKQDNGQRLSGMMTHVNPAVFDDIDQSFASDFDESARWMKQMRQK